MDHRTTNFTCAGTGLISLDVLFEGKSDSNPSVYAGGSCGNVLSILSYLKVKSLPISRLGKNKAAELIIDDFRKWGINTQFIDKEIKGSTPIIIHRILDSQSGNPKHRFEFKNPDNGAWFPRFRPVLAKKVDEINEKLPEVDVFYFDRASRSSIELAKAAKQNGTLVYFEPSSCRDQKLFKECLETSDILKYSNDRLPNFKSRFPTIQATLEIETRGKEGLAYRFKSNVWNTIKAYKIADVLDTAGAGDWCSAGIIKKLLDSKIKDLDLASSNTIKDALHYGQAVGALSCLFKGARGLMYNLSVQNFHELIDELTDPSLKTSFKGTTTSTAASSTKEFRLDLSQLLNEI